MTKKDTNVLSGGLSGCESKTATTPTNGYKVGTKNIPALFWKKMSSTNGQKETEGKKKNGND